MYTRADINEFVAQKKIALAGISHNKRKFGNIAFDELRKKGYEIYLVHPHAEEIEGNRCYPGLNEIPEAVDGVLICVPPDKSLQIVKDAAQAGIPRVWMQQGAASEEAIRFSQSNNLKLVHGECILMFAEPAGFMHRLHRGILNMFGKLPH